MKKLRSSKRKSFLFPKNKWARIGKNFAYFTVSFIFYFFVYSFRWIVLFVRSVFAFLSKKNRPSEIPNVKADTKPLDRFGRLEVLMAQLENRPIQEGLNVGSIINLTDGCSEADLVKIVARVGKKGSAESICEQDLLLAVRELRGYRKNASF